MFGHGNKEDKIIKYEKRKYEKKNEELVLLELELVVSIYNKNRIDTNCANPRVININLPLMNISKMFFFLVRHGGKCCAEKYYLMIINFFFLVSFVYLFVNFVLGRRICTRMDNVDMQQGMSMCLRQKASKNNTEYFEDLF